ISESAGELHFRVCPPSLAPRDHEVQTAVGISPCVAGLELVRSISVARNLPDFPFVTAERQRSRSWRDERAGTLRCCHRGDCAAALRQRFDSCRRTIRRLDQQRRVLRAEMDHVLPSRAFLDVCEWLDCEGLHPPDAALREQDNFLIGPGAPYATGNRLRPL